MPRARQNKKLYANISFTQSTELVI